MLSWLQMLPGELLRCRPVLSVHYAGALLSSGQLEGVRSATTELFVAGQRQQFRNLARVIDDLKEEDGTASDLINPDDINVVMKRAAAK